MTSGGTPEKTRRVLSISTLWPNSAQPRFGTFVSSSLEALHRHTNWQVEVINPIGLPPVLVGRYKALAKAARSSNEGEIHVHRPIFRLIPELGGRFNPKLIARAILPLAQRLHAEKPFDLVDAQFFYPDGPAAAQVAESLGLPLSVKARGADIHYWGARSYGRAALLQTADKASGLLAVSSALADDMAHLGMRRDKITVHYTGLDRDRFRPLQHAGLRPRIAAELDLAIAKDDRLLVTVGALIERKGQAIALRAAAGIENARVLFVGSGEDRDSLRRLASDLGMGERVHFLGSLNHDLLPLVLSAADAMVLPSASEGLANAWIEALACGTPIVITDAGGAREVVRSPAAGIIVARNADAVRRGIELVLGDRHDPQDVAAAVSGFSWRANAEALACHYDRLVAAT